MFQGLPDIALGPSTRGKSHKTRGHGSQLNCPLAPGYIISIGGFGPGNYVAIL